MVYVINLSTIPCFTIWLWFFLTLLLLLLFICPPLFIFRVQVHFNESLELQKLVQSMLLCLVQIQWFNTGDRNLKMVSYSNYIIRHESPSEFKLIGFSCFWGRFLVRLVLVLLFFFFFISSSSSYLCTKKHRYWDFRGIAIIKIALEANEEKKVQLVFCWRQKRKINFSK